MEKFIYVFNEKARDILISQGCVLLKADIKNSIFVFENRENCQINFSNISCVFSNTLTF